MKDKHTYIEGFLTGSDKPEDIAEKIAVFSAFTEGMQLFSSFIMLLNFARQGKMKSMCQIIQWSIVDETQHAEGMIDLFRVYVNENKKVWNDGLKSKIYTIAETMVSLEDAFIDNAFATGGVVGLSADDVKKYIRYITDRRLISLGLKGIFKVKTNPLPWVANLINAPGHTNFFENRSTDYAKGIERDWDSIWA
jgi:ribonucleoside-diphosphate reductase beta chain